MSGPESPAAAIEMRLALPCTHESVRVARNLARHFARLAGVIDTEVETLVLVAAELLSNAVDHGGGEAALSNADLHGAARMHMRLALAGPRWDLEVVDRGDGDVEGMRAKLGAHREPAPEQERGRGIFLVAQMVDRIEVDRGEGGHGVRVRVSRVHERG